MPRFLSMVRFVILGAVTFPAGTSGAEAAETTMRERTRQILLSDPARPTAPGPRLAARRRSDELAAQTEAAIELPKFRVEATRPTELSKRLDALGREQASESQLLRSFSEDRTQSVPGLALLKDPTAESRAKLGRIRVRVMDLERILLIAAHAANNPEEAAALQKLIAANRVLRNNVSTDTAFFFP
ncbi:MAG: hypothetical protein HY302_07795 [Opitutae bacterium]|nr:hypothetical protein [Opitutae bacterium]